jgi:hypothetical protein
VQVCHTSARRGIEDRRECSDKKSCEFGRTIGTVIEVKKKIRLNIQISILVAFECQEVRAQ